MQQPNTVNFSVKSSYLIASLITTVADLIERFFKKTFKLIMNIYSLGKWNLAIQPFSPVHTEMKPSSSSQTTHSVTDYKLGESTRFL